MVFLISQLHSLTLKVWIVICHIFDLLEQLIMSYCVSGGSLGFSVWLLSQSFSLWRFLPTHLGLYLHNNFCDTACHANSPILNPVRLMIRLHSATRMYSLHIHTQHYGMYSVSENNPPCGFLTFFPKPMGMGIF